MSIVTTVVPENFGVFGEESSGLRMGGSLDRVHSDISSVLQQSPKSGKIPQHVLVVFVRRNLKTTGTVDSFMESVSLACSHFGRLENRLCRIVAAVLVVKCWTSRFTLHELATRRCPCPKCQHVDFMGLCFLISQIPAGEGRAGDNGTQFTIPSQ